MSDEKKESRINIEDLPQAEQELTAEEAKDVKGGLLASTYGRGSNVATGDVNNDGRLDANFGDTPGLNGGDMVSKMS
jgi:hypothetical protein